MAGNLRGQLLGVLQAARAIAPALGLHPVRVVVRSQTWSSGKPQTGTPTTADLVLGAPDPASGAILSPHVEGSSGDPEITVGPLTPFDAHFAPRGFTPAQLNPGDGAGVTWYYLVTFPDGVARPFVLAPRGLNTTNPLHYTVKLVRLDRKVPF